MIKFFTTSICLAFLTGCMSNNYATLVEPIRNSKPVNLSTPDLNEVTTSELGDNMLSYEVGQFSVIEKTVITTTDTLQKSLITKTPELLVGSVGREYKGSKGEFSACFEGSICMFDKDRDGRFESITHPGSLVSLGANIGYITKTNTEEMLLGGYMKKTIIYQGLVNNSLKFSYREYADRTARPAFNQDFEIEKNKAGATVFGFKGARFEVSAADNIEITYKVSAYFK